MQPRKLLPPSQRPDVWNVEVDASTHCAFARYESKGWKGTSKLEVAFASLSVPSELPPFVAIHRNGVRLGYAPNLALQRSGVATRSSGIGYIYKLRQSDLLFDIPAPAPAAAVAAVDADGDSTMTTAAVVETKQLPPPPQQQQKPCTPLHASFDFYQTPPIVPAGAEFSLPMITGFLEMRLKFLLLAEAKEFKPFDQNGRDFLLLENELAVNVDRFTMLLTRQALCRHQQLLELWVHAERALFAHRIHYGFRFASSRVRFASRFVEGALPIDAYKQPTRAEKADALGVNQADGDWIAVPFEKALPLVRRRQCLLRDGIAMFPASDEAAIVTTATDRLFKTVLSQAPSPPPSTDIRVKTIYAEFRRAFANAFSLATPTATSAAFGQPVGLLEGLHDAKNGAPACIRGVVGALVKARNNSTAAGPKSKRIYMHHAARLAFGAYIRDRGISARTVDAINLLRRGMFTDEAEWKAGIQIDIFPAPGKKDKRNYSTSCGVLQKDGLCPFVTLGVDGDEARLRCAASIKMPKDKVLRQPMQFTAEFYAQQKAAATS